MTDFSWDRISARVAHEPERSVLLAFPLGTVAHVRLRRIPRAQPIVTDFQIGCQP